MVTERGQVKVLDFGLAKRMPTAASIQRDSNPTMTIAAPGQVFGTIAYMSPEQADAKDVDTRSDVFSFGTVLYEMVTGRRAFQEDGALRTLAAVVSKEPRPVREVAPETPRRLEQIVERFDQFLGNGSGLVWLLGQNQPTRDGLNIGVKQVDLEAKPATQSL